MERPARIIGVIGSGEANDEDWTNAERVGWLLAQKGCVVVTGGLGGVMEAASKGAKEAGGLVVAVLPGCDGRTANSYVDVPIVTGMGEARNVIIVNTAEAFIAVGGAYGTLSEIALALRRGRPIASLGSWDVDPAIQQVDSPEEAVTYVIRALERSNPE